MLWSDEQLKPIQHLRVIDLTVMLTGPYLTRILAQYGAEVIKVEKLPEGDHLRLPEFQGLFELLNQGKKSFGVNLDVEEGRELVRQLASEADVFVENFKSGVMERMGLGYSDLSERNPDLLYVSLRGLSGIHVARSGHDLNFIAASGVGEWFLESGPNYSTFFGDIVGGTLVPAIRVLAHLANPNRRGMHLVTHMDEGFRSLYLARAFEAAKAESASSEQKKNYSGSEIFGGKYPHSRYFKCRDGQWISLQAIQQKHWEAFCDVIDKKDWVNRHSDPTLIKELEILFGDAPATYWEALAVNKEACLFRVVPWIEHLNFSQAKPQLLNDPLAWAGFSPNGKISKVSELGADTYGLLNSIGLDNSQISERINKGIVKIKGE